MIVSMSHLRAVALAAAIVGAAAPLAAQQVAGGGAAPTPTPAPASADVTPTPPPPVVRAPDTIPYRLNAGDDIEVYVWGEERLQRQIRILPDGTMAMPLVGQLNAQGLLPEQLQDAISKRLAGQYRGAVPQVTVTVRNPAGLQFSVLGKVKSPGAFTPGRYVNVLEALTLAGGPAEFANLDNITIVRKTGSGVSNIRARLGGVLRNGVSSDQTIPRIQSGDTIIVP